MQELWNNAHTISINLNERDVILGYNAHIGSISLLNMAVNLVILHAKAFIFKCKQTSTEMTILS